MAEKNLKGLRVAIIAADAEFSKAAAGSGQAIAKDSGMELVLDQAYPPSTTDFSSILRNIKAAAPDAVYVCSYPPDSAAIVNLPSISAARSRMPRMPLPGAWSAPRPRSRL